MDTKSKSLVSARLTDVYKTLTINFIYTVYEVRKFNRLARGSKVANANGCGRERVKGSIFRSGSNFQIPYSNFNR